MVIEDNAIFHQINCLKWWHKILGLSGCIAERHAIEILASYGDLYLQDTGQETAIVKDVRCIFALPTLSRSDYIFGHLVTKCKPLVQRPPYTTTFSAFVMLMLYGCHIKRPGLQGTPKDSSIKKTRSTEYEKDDQGGEMERRLNAGWKITAWRRYGNGWGRSLATAKPTAQAKLEIRSGLMCETSLFFNKFDKDFLIPKHPPPLQTEHWDPPLSASTSCSMAVQCFQEWISEPLSPSKEDV